MPSTAAGRADKSAAGGRRVRPADENTRALVIEAALDTICALGYYQATSNEIARRAGVSWGVIQYYFGTREALLLAVLEDAVERALADLDNARIAGSGRRVRLRQLFNLILSFYGRREYAAILQVLWNLSRHPGTGDPTERALLRHVTGIRERWHQLFVESIDGTFSDAAVSMSFALMWGVAMEDAANAYMRLPAIDADRLPIELRTEMLLDALEGVLDNDQG
jgi:AcrR family transcriptional regulator